MRTAFRARLAALDSDLVHLAEQVGQVVRDAAQANLRADLGLAEAALSEVVEIEQTTREVAERGMYLVARQQPVAHDLRVLLAAQREAQALGRMARLAGHVASAARRRYPRHTVPREVTGVVADMSEVAQTMSSRLARAISGHDVTLAYTLVGLNEQMDRLHREMLTIVRSTAWPYDVDTAVEITILSGDLERFGDQAMDVAAAIVYVETGVPLR